MAKRKQKEMAGDGFKEDSSGKIAKELLQCNEDIREAHEERDRLSKALVESLQAQGRTEIKVSGKRLAIEHVTEKDRISVKKDRSEKAEE